MISSQRSSSLLTNLGRSSTPEVVGSYTELSFSRLTGTCAAKDACFVVVTDGLRSLLEERVPVVALAPGKTEMLETSGVPILIVEQAALNSGAWIGTGDFVSAALVEQLYQAQATARREGGMALWVDSAMPKSAAHQRLISASSGVFQILDAKDTELDGGRSPLWGVLHDYVIARGIDGGK